jgi:hypothetical protein
VAEDDLFVARGVEGFEDHGWAPVRGWGPARACLLGG